MRANASKHKAMSCGRMDAAEACLRAEIDAYLDTCDQQDERGAEVFGATFITAAAA